MPANDPTWLDISGARFSDSRDPRFRARLLTRPIRFLVGLLIIFTSIVGMLIVCTLYNMADSNLLEPRSKLGFPYNGALPASPGLIFLAWGLYLASVVSYDE